MIRSQETTNPTLFDSFVDEVINFVATDRTSKKRRITEVAKNEATEEWLPWHEAEGKEGYDVLLAMVTSGTIESRRHEKLPADSPIPWPKNLQVRYIRVQDIKTKGTEESTTNEIETEGEEAHSSFETQFQAQKLNLNLVSSAASGLNSSDAMTLNRLPSAPSSGSLSSAGLLAGVSLAAPPSAEEIRDKAVVAHLRKAHNAWDKARREVQSTINQSKENANTQGCKFESDLATAIITGDTEDVVLVELEQKFMRGERYTIEEITNSSNAAQNLKDLIKKANKMMIAMKPWFLL